MRIQFWMLVGGFVIAIIHTLLVGKMQLMNRTSIRKFEVLNNRLRLELRNIHALSLEEDSLKRLFHMDESIKVSELYLQQVQKKLDEMAKLNEKGKCLSVSLDIKKLHKGNSLREMQKCVDDLLWIKNGYKNNPEAFKADLKILS